MIGALDDFRKTQRHNLDFRNFSDRDARRTALSLPPPAADPMPSSPTSVRHLRWNDIP
jgi:hypothetical protein